MDKVATLLKNIIEKNNSPSVQYIFFNNDHILGEYGFGLADISRDEKVSNKTTYNAFSVTKTFTALAVLQLAEKKLLAIEEPIHSCLPDFPYSSDITIQQLLSHSAGIPNPIPISW